MKIVVGDNLLQYYNPTGITNSSSIARPGFGLGWTWQTLSDGRRYIGHSGALPGARHWMLANENSSLGVIVLSNGDPHVPSDRSAQYYKILESIHLKLFRCFEM